MTLPNLEKYRPYYEGFNMTNEEKDEVTMALWKVGQHFVDQAFGRDPLNITENVQEQALEP